MQGTWGDAMIIQAVADQLKLKITIAETHEGFREYSIIQPVSSTQQLTHVYLGHIDEYHYVSTLPCTSMSGFVEINPEQSTQSAQPKQTRTQYLNKYMKQKRANETQSPEAKEKRRVYEKEYRKRKRASESSQPSALSIEAKHKKRLYAKEYRKHKRACESSQPSTLSIEAKQKKRLYAKGYRKQRRCEIEPLQSLISKFHDIVSQGPLYIWTGCDQLWYKHSVIPVTITLKENNPDVQKRLLNRKSVNNVEWLCKTCNKHLKNNKVPPCAAVNGLQLPEKPSFFDLN
jgi:hypothetical protein